MEKGEAEIYSLCFGNGRQTLATVHYQSAGHCSAVNQEGEVDVWGFFLFKEEVLMLDFQVSDAALGMCAGQHMQTPSEHLKVSLWFFL